MHQSFLNFMLKYKRLTAHLKDAVNEQPIPSDRKVNVRSHNTC